MVFDRVLPTAPRLGCDEDMLVMNNYKSSESDSNGLSRYAGILWFNGCSKYFNCMCYYAMFIFVFLSSSLWIKLTPNHPWADHPFCDLSAVAKFVLTSSKWKTGNLQAIVNHSSLLRNNHRQNRRMDPLVYCSSEIGLFLSLLGWAFTFFKLTKIKVIGEWGFCMWNVCMLNNREVSTVPYGIHYTVSVMPARPGNTLISVQMISVLLIQFITV